MADQIGCYYVAKTGETRGPTTLLALKALIRAHAPDVDENTLIFLDGAKEWQPFKLVTSLEAPSTSMALQTEQEIDQIDHHNHEHEDGEQAERHEGDHAQEGKRRNARKKNKSAANCSVYIQGLPQTVTEDELAQYFSRCGILKKDGTKPRIKVYRDEEGKPKGDALVTYLLPESVFLAIQRYDDSEFRDGYKISVGEAQFSQDNNNNKGSSNDKLRKRDGDRNDGKAVRAKKVKRLQERAQLSWNEDSYTTKEAALLIVVIKNMFDPQALQKGGEQAIQELEQDLVEGLSSLCPTGNEVKKITIFKSHPEGVVLIRFVDAVLASECVQLLNGRYFDGRKLDVALWDGITEYAPNDDAEARMEEQAKRMEAYDEWLENQDQEDDEEEQES